MCVCARALPRPGYPPTPACGLNGARRAAAKVAASATLPPQSCAPPLARPRARRRGLLSHSRHRVAQPTTVKPTWLVARTVSTASALLGQRSLMPLKLSRGASRLASAALRPGMPRPCCRWSRQGRPRSPTAASLRTSMAASGHKSVAPWRRRCARPLLLAAATSLVSATSPSSTAMPPGTRCGRRPRASPRCSTTALRPRSCWSMCMTRWTPSARRWIGSTVCCRASSAALYHCSAPRYPYMFRRRVGR